MSDTSSDDLKGPILGPCQAWIAGSDVAACTPCSEFGTDADVAELLEQVAVEASMALFEISGEVYTGECEWTVRPCQNEDCWSAFPVGVPSPWMGAWTYEGMLGGWGWYDRGRHLCGCKPLSVVKLAGTVREIVEVRIDGEVLPELDDNGHRNYRLDDWESLVRMDDPGPPVTTRRWPACQNMSLDPDQPGTFAVTYKWGVEPPDLAKRAAAALACQLALSCPGVMSASGEQCLIPEGVTKVVRQGIEIDMKLLAGFFNREEPTGIVPLDLFLSGYMGANVGSRPAAVWSPDVQQYARRTG